MHRDLLDIYVKRIRARVSQGDGPTEPALSAENLEDAVLALADEVERLTRERDEAHMFVEVTSEKLSEAVEDRAQATVRAQAAEAELTTLEAENKALREALERVRSTLATADESGLLRDVIWMVGSPNETLFDFLAALTPATGA